MTVLDASAALAFLQGEPGSAVVRENLGSSVIGAANLAEVLAKMTGSVERSLAEAVLVANGVRIAPLSAEDARLSAEIKESVSGLSLGDRLCLALIARLDDVALTADSAWGEGGRVRRIR